MALRIALLVFLTACLERSSAFMRVSEFYDSNLLRCYDTNAQDPRRSQYNIHGQSLPLPNSVETFVSLVETYESLNPNSQARDTVQKLLQSFRIDDLDADVQNLDLRGEGVSDKANSIKRAFFNVPQPLRYAFNDGDFSDDEKCALHLMLSHTVNDTKLEEGAVFNPNVAKQPLELGVVSLHSKWNHAFALGRVLMGISAAFLPTKEFRATAILQAMKLDPNPSLDNVNLNPVFAVTLGDMVAKLAPKNPSDDIKILPNGIWNDVVCPNDYKLEDNNGGFVTMSELRGGIDGLIIGKKLQDNKDVYADVKLSQILRQYYGYYGLLDNERTRWCQRERALLSLSELEGEMVNFNRLSKVVNGGMAGITAIEQVARALTEIRNKATKDMDAPECSVTEMSPDRKFSSPNNIFVILDFSSAKMQFQREVIGNLSANFDTRPRGNLMGVFTNMKSMQPDMLDTIVKNNGTAGCPSCFAKYYNRPSNREEESEVFRDLNSTLTTFEEDNDDLEQRYQDPKAGSPGKVVLYFNFGNPITDYRLQEALWDIEKYYGGVTILAVGDNKDTLKQFTENEDTDIFTGSNNAEKTAKDIKERLKTVPGEFQFKGCDQSSNKGDNKQEVFISPNKIQYWAMYPQYFLKSYGIKLKFKPQDGTSISVCFTRWFPSILRNDKGVECKTSNGEEIEFYTSNPCKKRNVYNCNPFYFSVEAKKAPIENCKSLRCNTPKDIQFEFQHEGISCNMASFATISNMALILAAVMFYLQQRH